MTRRFCGPLLTQPIVYNVRHAGSLKLHMPLFPLSLMEGREKGFHHHCGASCWLSWGLALLAGVPTPAGASPVVTTTSADPSQSKCCSILFLTQPSGRVTVSVLPLSGTRGGQVSSSHLHTGEFGRGDPCPPTTLCPGPGTLYEALLLQTLLLQTASVSLGSLLSPSPAVLLPHSLCSTQPPLGSHASGFFLLC